MCSCPEARRRQWHRRGRDGRRSGAHKPPVCSAATAKLSRFLSALWQIAMAWGALGARCSLHGTPHAAPARDWQQGSRQDTLPPRMCCCSSPIDMALYIAAPSSRLAPVCSSRSGLRPLAAARPALVSPSAIGCPSARKWAPKGLQTRRKALGLFSSKLALPCLPQVPAGLRASPLVRTGLFEQQQRAVQARAQQQPVVAAAAEEAQLDPLER